jgi:hypothetical protein
MSVDVASRVIRTRVIGQNRSHLIYYHDMSGSILRSSMSKQVYKEA